MRLPTPAPLRYAVLGVCLAAFGCAHQPPVEPPYKPVTTVLELMESVIAHAAETYWESVQVTVDEEGVHERYPESDEEWEAVWAAALAIAESGNLLMMTPRAVDDGAWMQFSRSLIEAGVEAAAAAEAKNVERVFAAGEQVYNVCTSCHGRYATDLRRVAPGD
jgi:leucyl-tRNA synthetase